MERFSLAKGLTSSEYSTEYGSVCPQSSLKSLYKESAK